MADVSEESDSSWEVELTAVKKDDERKWQGVVLNHSKAKTTVRLMETRDVDVTISTEKHGKRERSGFHQWRGFCERSWEHRKLWLIWILFQQQWM